MSTVTVKIPPAFYDDHVARDLPAGTETHRTKKVVTVDLDADELAELVSDAKHYADSAADFWEDHRGLVISARATLKVLANVTPPSAPVPVSAAVTRIERMARAKVEAKQIKGWKAAGEKGPRPATPNLDAIEADAAARASGTATRPGQRRQLREVAPGTTLPSGHLAPGALGASVAAHIAEHAASDHGVGEVAKALGGKSAGAVRNALDRLVATGAATLTSEKPRRYQAAANVASGAA
jgi:hypothetical protein